MKIVGVAPKRFRGSHVVTYHEQVNESGAYVRFSYYVDLKRKRATVVKWLVGFKPGSWGRSYTFRAYLGEASMWIGGALADPGYYGSVHEFMDTWFEFSKSDVIEQHLLWDIPAIETELAGLV